MNSTQQVARSLPDRRRVKARRAAHSVEALETRFLLSGAATDPTGDVSTLFPLPADVAVQLPEGPTAPQATASLSDGTPSFRDDSYILDAANGLPGVQVDLIWPEGTDPAAGYLHVSDASGNLLYDLPLVGIAAIDAKFPIPSGQAEGWSNLDVSLQITLPGPDPTSTGSYHISISWDQTASTISLNLPSTAAGSAVGPFSNSGEPNGVDDSSPPASLPDPTLTATMALPAPLPAPPVMPGSSNSVASFGAGGAANAAGLSGVVTVPSTSSSSGSTAPTSTQVPLPTAGPASTSASGSSTIAVAGNRPAVVGPLPLSGSSPDGGIFAYPYGQTKGQVDPFRTTITITPIPDKLDSPDDLAEAPARHRSERYSTPSPLDVEISGLNLIARRPFDLDLAVSPLVTGAAFLPPIVHLVQGRLDRDSARTGAARWPIVQARWTPRGSLGAVLLGSAGLAFGLVAPDGLTLFTNWRDDRRWKRQFTIADPKRRPEPARDA